MAVTIENEYLKAVIAEKGAELTSLKKKDNGIEYIWQADPAYWQRHAPVLFPIVGKLKDDRYFYQGKEYHLSQHGFARDSLFSLVEFNQTKASFRLTSSLEHQEVYPFDFELIVIYELVDQEIRVNYQVNNLASDDLYFSIGGHPAFNVPLEENLTFEDYFLVLSPAKSRIRLPLKEGLIDLEHRTLGQTNTNLALTHDLFKDDAMIFATKAANSFTICSEKSSHLVEVSFKDLPYVGIWSTYPTESPFVCIEPWAGIADTVSASGNLEENLGIEKLAEKESFTCGYTIAVK